MSKFIQFVVTLALAFVLVGTIKLVQKWVRGDPPQETVKIPLKGGGFFLDPNGGRLRDLDEQKPAREMPPPGDPPKAGAKDLWPAGTKVLPKKHTDKLRFGDRDAGGQRYFKLTGRLPMEVRGDHGDGWVRIHDGRREGWAEKDDLVTDQDAAEYWDSALRANPRDSWVLYMRGTSWWQKGELDKAMQDFDRCISLDPRDAAAYTARGVVWAAKGDHDKAVADYTEAIRIDRDQAQAHYNRAHARHRQGDYDGAISDYTVVILLDPQYPSPRHGRGQAWAARGDYEKAIADYGEAIRLDPKNPRAYRSRAAAWAAVNESEKAEADLAEAARLEAKGGR